jgi:hypothetical protein
MRAAANSIATQSTSLQTGAIMAEGGCPASQIGPKKMGCGKECGVSLIVRAVSLAVGLFAVPQRIGHGFLSVQHFIFHSGLSSVASGKFTVYPAPTQVLYVIFSGQGDRGRNAAWRTASHFRADFWQ